MDAKRNPVFFGSNSSAALDIVRFSAALAVAVLHFQDIFVYGSLEPEWSGNAAVCVFFVLSGFVIRYVTKSRIATAGLYWIDRGSRFYSVVLPALLLTVAAEAIAARVNPGLYSLMSDPFHWRDVPWQVVTNLVFTVGFWGYGSMPLSNGAFWSLTFEVVFYLLYGVVYFRYRWNWGWALLILFIAGPSIALLFPIWLLGVALYDAYAALSKRGSGVAIAASVAAIFFAALTASRHRLASLLHGSDVSARAAWLSSLLDRSETGRRWFHGTRVPWLDRLSLSFYITGLATAVAVLVLLLLCDRYLPPIHPRLRSVIRTVADSTFVLYLIHLPLGIVVTALVGHRLNSWRSGSLLLVGVMAVSMVMAIACDRLKGTLRSALRSRFLRSAA